ncbi:nucleotidyl transferase AbiEii/AbiGii toxin family protein [Leadbettera azotonutricia]|uniref:Conserved domain protein n=1 Tax=Leadbettera azotonutricia (strain ATCC BAA-888 / DSM 13862 / ZAS-9) TaxID=545695 RepID=F5YB26_LEAAZ|nr:nucleotidyl transferase AbiEii/AbiGii toxin family protein [Leadbettera azotonutricia]AEF82379.1 conserved domain protein [Leadbettera azotonutricia ZAS-9]
MNLFEKTIEAALEADASYIALRPVVEKEILHHDILREMNKAGYLKGLTFMGGTCLRSCYGSERLSEDLDFSGGFGFKKQDLTGLGLLIKEALQKKYDLPVSVSEPEKETGNTDTWKIKIITRPERPDFPAQRINIDICMLPSHEPKPAMLRNHYQIDSGTSGMILYAESLPEILADKIIALALRLNRIKNRDLWDIFWLSSRNILLSGDLLEKKLADRKISVPVFLLKYNQRLEEIKDGQQAFLTEMRRFLAPQAFTKELTGAFWWEHLLSLLRELALEGR